MDYDEVRNSLDRVTNTMLDNLECGTSCTRIVVSSHGAPLMRHPPRYSGSWHKTVEKSFCICPSQKDCIRLRESGVGCKVREIHAIEGKSYRTSLYSQRRTRISSPGSASTN